MIKIPDSTSLANTIDLINAREFYGKAISTDEAKQGLDWLGEQYGVDGAYADTFGITRLDGKRKLHTFTGEHLQSASRLHIHAEEACRAMIVLNRESRREQLPELSAATRRLLDCFEIAHQKGTPRGTYCCGPCTVSVWRHMAAGGLGAYARYLDEGLGTLKQHEKGNGEWRRFPFYYTLLVLAEVDTSNARQAAAYAVPVCERRLRTARGNMLFKQRRIELLSRILNKYS